MDAGRVTLFVERFAEPYSGMPLLGVGGFCADRLERIDVRYDGTTAITTTPTNAIFGSPHAFHYAVHLPIEEKLVRVQVVAVFANGLEVRWYDEPFERIGHRGDTNQTAGFARKFGPINLLSPRKWKARMGRAIDFIRTAKQKIDFRLLRRWFPDRTLHDAYVESSKLDGESTQQLRQLSSQFRYRPVISILCPVFNVDPKWLREAVESVRSQTYERWELCLADDASTNRETVQYLKSLVGSEPRIKVVFREKNGHICAATNSAAELATGEFVALMDNDDSLAADALSHVVSALQSRRDADLIYSDEDKIDAAGRRYDPQFKPDWSPELLFSYNFVNHFTVMRRSLFESVGRFRVGYEGSQDHDLLLRLTERTERVVHIPRILYHWRALPSSTATAAGVKSYVHTSGRKAIEEALARRGIDVTPFVPPFAERLGLPVLAFDGTDDGPFVSIIIAGSAELADRTERAIHAHTGYLNYSVVRCEDSAEGRNRAAAKSTAECLLFLEAGIEPSDSRWLSRLVANLQLPQVGACGGLLRDESGKIVSAGVVHGMRDGVGPADAFCGTAPDAISYYFYAEVTRNVSAVSGRCLLTSRTLFERLGGFDSERFPTTMWDCDYAARVRSQGLRCVHVGGAELVARNVLQVVPLRLDDPVELLAFRKAHGENCDPYHNPNCSTRETFSLRGDMPVSVGGAPMRTLVLAHNLAAAEGAPRYLSDIIVGLKQRGTFDPILLAAFGGVGEESYRHDGIPIELIDPPWRLRLIDGLWTRAEYQLAVESFSQILNRQRPDLVVANTLLTFPIIEAAARLGIPTVWIIHESYSEGVLARLFSPFAKGRCEAAFSLATRVVPCSHDTAALYRRLNSRNNVRVVHNAISSHEIDRYAKRVSRTDAIEQTLGSRHQPRLISVGTICERKGQHTLVEAAAILARQKADFEVQLIGARAGIPYLEYVRQLIARHRLESIVRVIPETDAMPYFRAADAFVCTSHMETYSRSILEAEAFGLPIVSTPCCGANEQVSWGHNALSFPFGDAERLAEHLRTLLDDRDLRERMGRASRAMFELHPSFDAMLDSFDSVFRMAAGPRFRLAMPDSIPAIRKAA